MNNFDKVKAIIVEELGVPEEKVTVDAKIIEDLGADSLSLVEMLMNFENEYDVTIPDESFDGIETVGDIIKALDALEAGK